MKILITGGTGYIGSALYPYLLHAGHQVDTLDTEQRGNKINAANIKCDYRVFAGYDKYETVIHLAGHSSVGDAVRDPYGAYKNNLDGLVHMTRRLVRGQRLLYASSASVLAPADGHQNIYDATKRAAEAIMPELYDHAYGMRFGTVNGPSANIRTDLMINRMVLDAMTKGAVNVTNLHVSRPILGIDDLCYMVATLVEVPEGATPPGAYNLLSFNATVGAIAAAVSTGMGVPLVKHPDTPTYDFEMQRQMVTVNPSTVRSLTVDLKAHYEAVGMEAVA